MRSQASFVSLMVLLGGASVTPESLAVGDGPRSWNWQPRADSITIERPGKRGPAGRGCQPARLGQDRFRVELHRLQPQPGHPWHALSPLGLGCGWIASGRARLART